MAKFIAKRILNDKELPEVDNLNDFAFLYSGCFKKIAGMNKYERTSTDNDLYLKLSNGKRKIYLKYHTCNVTQDTVLLSYTNLCRLGLCKVDNPVVEISESNSFQYQLHHGNAVLKCVYRLTLISLGVSIASLIVSVISLF